MLYLSNNGAYMVKDKSTQEDGNPYDKVVQTQQSEAAQKPQRNQKQEGTSKKAKSGAGLHIAAVLIIIAVLAAVAILYLRSSAAPQINGLSPSSPIGSAASSNPAIAELAKKNLNTTDVISAFAKDASQVNSSNELNVSYSGSAALGLGGLSSIGLAITLPFNITYSKYGKDSALRVHTGGVAGISSGINESYYIINGTSYDCNSSLSASNSTNVTCTVSSASANPSQIIYGLSNQSKKQALAKHLSFSNSTLNQSSYNGIGCSLFSTYMRISNLSSGATQPSQSSIPISIANSSIRGRVTTCIDDQNSLPLTLQLDINISSVSSGVGVLPNSSVKLAMHETSMSNSVGRAYVTVLPGPVVNSSYSISAGTLNTS